MWLDCKLIDKLINLDSVKSFDIIKNDDESEHDFRLEIKYANVFDIQSAHGDPMGGSVAECDVILQGTYSECREEYNQLFNQIAMREKEIVETMKAIATAFQSRPINETMPAPSLRVSKPDIIDTPSPEGAMDAVTEIKDLQKPEPVDVKRILLYVIPSNYPAREGSEDKRGVRGAGAAIKSMMRVIYSIRENDIDVIPDWYTKQEGDFEFTISKNMARESELKQMANMYGFVNLIE